MKDDERNRKRVVGQVLATVPDCHFGSGSGTKLNHCANGGPNCQ